jgi:murein DD-endopeptidase MepM/ murein hydrolase activator NlpD
MLSIKLKKIQTLRKALPLLLVAVSILLIVLVTLALDHRTDAHPKYLLFPLAGNGTYSNDFFSPRDNGQHNATDIFAPKGTKIIAAVAGTVTYVPISQPSFGYMVRIEDDDGFSYDYIHINNDTPGTDDGNGGPMNAYAPDIKVGNRVARGQFLGYVGDSGNAETTASHLHFEITRNDGLKINPYPYLQEAERYGEPAIYPPLPSEILPYGPSINATVSIAAGKFDSTGTSQLVTGAGPGVRPHVRVLRADGTEVSGFYAYDPSFQGGVNVASGDVDGDGIDEIITGPVNGAPHVRIFKTNGTEVGGFYAYSPSFTGGVNVGSVDADNNGTKEILVGAGPGGSPHVRVLKVDGSEVSSFYAYEQSFHGGIDVAGGDVTGTTAKEIVTTPGPGGSSYVRIFTSAGVPVGNGFAGYENFTGGTHVSVGNVRTSSAKDEILLSPWQSGSPHIRLLNADGSVVREAMYYESWWDGHYDVAASDGKSYISTGYNRRSSIRPGPN